jgi:nicotinate-nucleotide adenylyltransferase
MNGTQDIQFPDAVRTVAVYGGTFDPPTRAHAALPLAVVDAIGADWLLVIPAAASPFKPGGAHATDPQRLEMLKQVFADRPCVTVSSIELTRGGTSFTVDTLRTLSESFPDITLRLIIGADQAESFHRWRAAHEIVRCAEPVVMLRGDGGGVDRLMHAMAPHWSEDELDAWRQRVVAIPMLDASSTEARAILASATSEDTRLLELLEPASIDYIRNQGLYGARTAH